VEICGVWPRKTVGGGGGGGELPITPKKEKVPFVVPGAPMKPPKLALLEKGLELANAQEQTIIQQNLLIASLMKEIGRQNLLIDEQNKEIEELKEELIAGEMYNNCLKQEADMADAMGGGGGA
jgi:hypothetical protein